MVVRMNLEKLKEKLRKYKKEDIMITDHAQIQAYIRGINLEEVKNNIINPEKLVYYKEQESKKSNEEKYDCYFAYAEDFYQRYIIITNGKLIIVTIISINRRWQHLVEKGK